MKGRWLVVALVVSLVANLALVGFVVGVASGPAPWLARGANASVGLGRLMRFLPDERRREVLGAPSERRELRRSLREAHRAQHAIRDALAADPFEPAALNEALQAFQDHYAATQKRSHAAFAAAVARLTPDERREFVDTMRRWRDARLHRRNREDAPDAPR